MDTDERPEPTESQVTVVTATRRLARWLREEGADDIAVCVGGVIPKKDISALETLGVRGIFPGGARIDDIVATIEGVAR